MRFKKMLSLLLVIVFVCMSLSACKNSDKTTESSTQPKKEEVKKEEVKNDTSTEATTTEEAAPAETGLTVTDKEMTITLWDIATEDPANTIQQGAVDRFMADHPNIKVETTHIQNDTYKEKLVIAMSSGECPDMYMHWGGGPMNEYINSGFGVPVTDLVKNYCDVDFLDAAIAQSTYNGEIYAVPYGGIGGSGIFYNKTIFSKLNLTVPTTISELEKVCDTLKANGYIPFSLANQNKWTGSMYFMYLAARFGGVDEFNAAVSGTGSFESDAFQYAAETIQKWIKAGYFPDGVNSLNTDDGQDRQLMYTEEAAMMLHGSWQAASMKNDNEEWYTQNIDYFTFPKLETSKADQSIVVGTSIGNGFTFNTGDDKDKLNACFILATQYYNDDTYNQAQLKAGTIPSINGMGDTIEDPCMQKIWTDFTNASNVQLWYDQYLPPTVSEAHQSTCQEIFGLTMTAAEANKTLQDAMKEYLTK
jgi:raffinose/stachyose/melibiose transport system substrate-binding protein